MAASLRSTRHVAKAALPNRVGRLGHRLSERILTMKARHGIPLSPNAGFAVAGNCARRSVVARKATLAAKAPDREDTPVRPLACPNEMPTREVSELGHCLDAFRRAGLD
jgi:hypothetical protein